MTTATRQLPGIFGQTSHSNGAIARFSAELLAFVAAILNPSKTIREVEDAMTRHADKIEGSDPGRASALRKLALRNID